jgi:hypothetical protein
MPRASSENFVLFYLSPKLIAGEGSTMPLKILRDRGNKDKMSSLSIVTKCGREAGVTSLPVAIVQILPFKEKDGLSAPYKSLVFLPMSLLPKLEVRDQPGIVPDYCNSLPSLFLHPAPPPPS